MNLRRISTLIVLIFLQFFILSCTSALVSEMLEDDLIVSQHKTIDIKNNIKATESYRLGMFSLDRRNYIEANYQLTKSIWKSKRTIPELYYNRAIARNGMGQFNRARKDLIKYLKLNPEAEDRIEVQRMILVLSVENHGLGRTYLRNYARIV